MDKKIYDTNPGLIFPNLKMPSVHQMNTAEKLEEVMNRLDVVVEKLEDLKIMKGGYSLRKGVWR